MWGLGAGYIETPFYCMTRQMTQMSAMIVERLKEYQQA